MALGPLSRRHAEDNPQPCSPQRLANSVLVPSARPFPTPHSPPSAQAPIIFQAGTASQGPGPSPHRPVGTISFPVHNAVPLPAKPQGHPRLQNVAHSQGSSNSFSVSIGFPIGMTQENCLKCWQELSFNLQFHTPGSIVLGSGVCGLVKKWISIEVKAAAESPQARCRSREKDQDQIQP